MFFFFVRFCSRYRIRFPLRFAFFVALLFLTRSSAKYASKAFAKHNSKDDAELTLVQWDPLGRCTPLPLGVTSMVVELDHIVRSGES